MFYKHFERFWHASFYFSSTDLSLTSNEFWLALINHRATQKELKVDKTASKTFRVKSSVTGAQGMQQNESRIWHLAFGRYRQVVLIVVLMMGQRDFSESTKLFGSLNMITNTVHF